MASVSLLSRAGPVGPIGLRPHSSCSLALYPGREEHFSGQRFTKTTMIGGHAQKESIEGGIIILLSPPPMIDPFPAWRPPLCLKGS